MSMSVLFSILAFQLSLNPSSSPCLSSDNHFLRLFEKTVEGLNCKINNPALGAVLLYSWAGQTDKHQQYLLAATGLIEENMLPLLLH